MKRLLALTSLLLFTVAMAADPVTIADLVKDPAKYDNKGVIVVGKVAKFRAKTSLAGNKYFTFTLEGGRDHVAIFGMGELDPAPKDGDKVEATGLFAKARTQGDIIYKNEVDVTPKQKEKFGVKILD